MNGTTAKRMRVRMSLIALIAALAVAVPVRSAGDEILFQGTWTTGGYAIKGGWSIVQDGESRFVVLDEDFKTRRAPDLKIFLSPLPVSELGDRNATSGSELVAPLEAHEGAYRYPIADDVDLDSFRSIAVHCEEYSKYWAGADLVARDSGGASE